MAPIKPTIYDIGWFPREASQAPPEARCKDGGQFRLSICAPDYLYRVFPGLARVVEHRKWVVYEFHPRVGETVIAEFDTFAEAEEFCEKTYGGV